MTKEDFNKAIVKIFGKDAVIKTKLVGKDTVYVDVLDSKVKPVGEYMVKHVVTSEDGYYGFILSSLTFTQVKL